jgi:hypothetical protein
MRFAACASPAICTSYQVLVAHCNAYSDEDPRWKISRERVESELALYQRDLAENRI